VQWLFPYDYKLSCEGEMIKRINKCNQQTTGLLEISLVKLKRNGASGSIYQRNAGWTKEFQQTIAKAYGSCDQDKGRDTCRLI
jgi:hypothetical protein